MKIRAIEKYLKEKLLIPIVGILLRREVVSNDFFSSFLPKRIVVAKIHHKIGDLLVETPVLTNLKHRFPNAEIDFISGEYNYPAVYNSKYIKKQYMFKKSLSLNSIIHNFKQLKEMRKVGYDLGIVLSATAFSDSNALLVSLVNPKILVGLRSPKKTNCLSKVLYNYAAPWPGSKNHRTETSLSTIMPMVPEPKFKDEKIHFSALEITEAKKLVVKKSEKMLVGIHAGGTWGNKMWPTEKFLALMRMLNKDKNIQLVVFAGMPDEEKILEEIMGRLNERPIAIGPFKNPSCKTFRTMIACISILDLFIANDTGTLHAAAGTGVCTIGIYMKSDPNRWRPLNRNVHTMWRPDVDEVKRKAYALLEEVQNHSM